MLSSQHPRSLPECAASATKRDPRRSWALAPCRQLVTRVQATGTGAREQLPSSLMYQCSQSVTKKSNPISSKRKFTRQDYGSHEKKKIRDQHIKNGGKLLCQKTWSQGQIWNLLFLRKQWTANSLRSSTDTGWFPMGMGAAKPWLLRHLMKKKERLKVFSVSCHLITLSTSHEQISPFPGYPSSPNFIRNLVPLRVYRLQNGWRSLLEVDLQCDFICDIFQQGKVERNYFKSATKHQVHMPYHSACYI